MGNLEIGKTYSLSITITDDEVFDLKHPVSIFDIQCRDKAIKVFMDNNSTYPIYYKNIDNPLYPNEALQVIKMT